jgi:hypothetical protein
MLRENVEAFVVVSETKNEVISICKQYKMGAFDPDPKVAIGRECCGQRGEVLKQDSIRRRDRDINSQRLHVISSLIVALQDFDIKHIRHVILSNEPARLIFSGPGIPRRIDLGGRKMTLRTSFGM